MRGWLEFVGKREYETCKYMIESNMEDVWGWFSVPIMRCPLSRDSCNLVHRLYL